MSLEGRTLHSLAFKVLMSAHALAATGRAARPLNEFEMLPLLADLAGKHQGKRNVKKRIKAFEAAWARLQTDQPGYVQSAADAALENDLIEWLKFHRSMLIGEAIPLVYHYLKNNPASPICAEFSHVLVDEFQDLNKAEQGVLQLLAANAKVCIVGDDDQSIYSFKHAHPDGIRQWLVINPGATDLELAECRRCPTRIVVMANALIAHNQDRPVPRVLNPRPQNGYGDVDIVQYATLDDEVRGVVGIIEELIAGGYTAWRHSRASATQRHRHADVRTIGGSQSPRPLLLCGVGARCRGSADTLRNAQAACRPGGPRRAPLVSRARRR